jgi:hypothetical protein
VGARPGRAGIRASRPGRDADCTARGSPRESGGPPGPPHRGTAESVAYPTRLRAIHLSRKRRNPAPAPLRDPTPNGPLAAAERHTRGPFSPHGSLPERPQIHTPHCPGSTRSRAWARPAWGCPYEGCSVGSEAGPGKHAGRHADLAERRGTDPAALRPRGSHLHELLLELRESGGLVDLGEPSVDVEPLRTRRRPRPVGRGDGRTAFGGSSDHAWGPDCHAQGGPGCQRTRRTQTPGRPSRCMSRYSAKVARSPSS